MDYYSILELDINASKEDIKKAYHRLALKYHPDRHMRKSDEEKEIYNTKFKQINEAYVNLCNQNNINNDTFFNNLFTKYNLKVPDEFIKLSEKLLSPEKRQKIQKSINKLSKLFTEGLDQSYKSEFASYANFYNNVKTKKSQYKELPCGKSQDLILNVNVNIKDIYNNSQKNFNIEINRKCSECNGVGYLVIDQEKNLCHKCKGVLIQPKKTDISFFPSTNEIILNNQSHHEINKTPGDIIINVNPKDSDYKVINNHDLIHRINISLYEAYTGYNIKFTHLDDNDYNISFNEPILNKRIKKINNLGLLKNDNENRGDLFIKFNILLPKLNTSQINFLKTHEIFTEKELNINQDLDSLENINNYIFFNKRYI
jgi:DnaJ homolog subfamily B member 4